MKFNDTETRTYQNNIFIYIDEVDFIYFWIIFHLCQLIICLITCHDAGQDEVASTLVRHGCDTTAWSRGPEGCLQTLLHRAIDTNDENIACFLIRRYVLTW